MNFSSDGRPRYFADAPVAMMSASHVYTAWSPSSTSGRSRSPTVWMWSNTISVPKRSACFWKRSISSGPCTPPKSAGQLSTSVVVMS
jgi:hypothetical protein